MGPSASDFDHSVVGPPSCSFFVFGVNANSYTATPSPACILSPSHALRREEANSQFCSDHHTNKLKAPFGHAELVRSRNEQHVERVRVFVVRVGLDYFNVGTY